MRLTKATGIFFCMIQRRIPRVLSLNSAKKRLLSDKPRRRKWSLPPILPSPITLSTRKINPCTRESRPTSSQLSSPSSKAGKPSHEHPKLDGWAVQKSALKKKYPGGYHPLRKKVSPDAIEGIRILHRQVSACITPGLLMLETTVYDTSTCRFLQSLTRSHFAHSQIKVATIAPRTRG